MRIVSLSPAATYLLNALGFNGRVLDLSDEHADAPVRLAEFEPSLVFASTDDPHLPAWRSIIESICGNSAAPRFVATRYDTADAFMESALVIGTVIGRPANAVQLVLSIMRGGMAAD